MGAWDAGSFDNDSAGDWSDKFKTSRDLSLVIATFNNVLDEESEYVDATAGSEALAACEVLARLNGNWGPRNPYTKNVDDWVSAHPQVVPKDLVETANKVIDRILSPTSELAELWQGEEEWRSAVEDLRIRVCR